MSMLQRRREEEGEKEEEEDQGFPLCFHPLDPPLPGHGSAHSLTRTSVHERNVTHTHAALLFFCQRREAC